MSTEKIICAGFGGQGIMSLGQLIAYAGMLENKHVSWVPSYGPEMRGGTANCHVLISDDPIGSPLVSHDATAVIVMNLPSLVKFEPELQKGGHLLINCSLIDKEAERKDVAVHYITANDIAMELGNVKAANMVMLGAYLHLTHIVKVETVSEALKKVFGQKKAELIPLNLEALKRGAEAVHGSELAKH
ncbi:2-oxoacid:acceptor oxidoreductase family protein [bacterium]|nr:2-oxoacid:acceptor oxidoreductase family protein [bacterium]